MRNPADILSIEDLANENALQLIGILVDSAHDLRDAELNDRALEFADTLEKRGLREIEAALLDYFRANAWAFRYEQRLDKPADLWGFDQPELREQIFLLRRALRSPGFSDLDVLQRCQILTNLGNQLNAIGRAVEARHHWNRALELEPNFWMARANRGYGLMYFAVALYDPGHEAIFALCAHRDLNEAVKTITTHPSLGDPRISTAFKDAANEIEQRYDVAAIAESFEPSKWELGFDEIERAYRRWCLTNVLFLNPLNDVVEEPISANDILHLPDFAIAPGMPPVIAGMFNELKQTYVSARWLLWEGTQSREPHLSDRDVMLYDTLDLSMHGLSIEKVKIAFRMAYSILDKIAYFLNHYLSLGIPEKQVSFRTVWREKNGRNLRSEFSSSENWPFRGLYWLSKDLFDEDMRETIEPEAAALAELRNHLEHKYVKIRLVSPSKDGVRVPFFDPVAHSISHRDLVQRSLRMLQLARSAIIYLSLGVHRTEQVRAKDREGHLVVPVRLNTVDEDSKL